MGNRIITPAEAWRDLAPWVMGTVAVVFARLQKEAGRTGKPQSGFVGMAKLTVGPTLANPPAPR